MTEVKVFKRNRVVKNIIVNDYNEFDKLPFVFLNKEETTGVLIQLLKHICSAHFGKDVLLSLEEFDQQLCASMKGIVVKRGCKFTREINEFLRTHPKFNIPIIKFNNALEGIDL